MFDHPVLPLVSLLGTSIWSGSHLLEVTSVNGAFLTILISLIPLSSLSFPRSSTSFHHMSLSLLPLPNLSLVAPCKHTHTPVPHSGQFCSLFLVLLSHQDMGHCCVQLFEPHCSHEMQEGSQLLHMGMQEATEVHLIMRTDNSLHQSIYL